VKSDIMKTNFRTKIAIWVPFVFSVFICYQFLFLGNGQYRLSSLAPGFPAFICFLPMTFFFVATGVNSNIARLEKRLSALEEK